MMFHDLEMSYGMTQDISGHFDVKPLCFGVFFKFFGSTQVPMRGVGPIGSLKVPNLWKMQTNLSLIYF
jgi:hypothetical protein